MLYALNIQKVMIRTGCDLSSPLVPICAPSGNLQRVCEPTRKFTSYHHSLLLPCSSVMSTPPIFSIHTIVWSCLTAASNVTSQPPPLQAHFYPHHPWDIGGCSVSIQRWIFWRSWSLSPFCVTYLCEQITETVLPFIPCLRAFIKNNCLGLFGLL